MTEKLFTNQELYDMVLSQAIQIKLEKREKISNNEYDERVQLRALYLNELPAAKRDQYINYFLTLGSKLDEIQSVADDHVNRLTSDTTKDQR